LTEEHTGCIDEGDPLCHTPCNKFSPYCNKVHWKEERVTLIQC